MSANQPEGYLATASSNSKPVLVLHAWWGLNDDIRAFCDQLSEAGFLAFAPDLYQGDVTDRIAEAEKLVEAVDDTRAKTIITDAVKFLQARSGKISIAVIGFSMGAYFALDASNRLADAIDSVVVFYGTGEDDFSRAKADFLGHFAENDPYEEQEYIDHIKTRLAETGCKVTFYSYPDTGHWFFEASRPDAYNQDAANQAWERTLAFLKR